MLRSLQNLRRRFDRRACGARRGFSLLEMLIVLAILAALTMVAVQSLEPVEQQARSAASLKTLDSMRQAIVSSNAAAVSGFIADNGCLPRHICDLTGTWNSRFWVAPNDMFASTTTNLPASLTGTLATVTFAPEPQTVTPGWRGPYVLAPSVNVGSATVGVVDGWGTSLLDNVSSTSPYSYSPSLVSTTGPTGVVGLAIRTSAKITDALAKNIIPASQYTASQICGNIYSASSNTGPYSAVLVAPNSTVAGGLVVYTIEATTTSQSSPHPVATYSITPLSTGVDNHALLVGPRLLGAAIGTAPTLSQTGSMQNIMVRPGSQTFDIYIP